VWYISDKPEVSNVSPKKCDHW